MFLRFKTSATSKTIEIFNLSCRLNFELSKILEKIK